ncbi:unnamed protein product [Fusarium equiseti]|uniref:Uncharacterized protein n=1 Tax=Fusarium equiseti TaxID=61235 RepID=A0A8J2NPC3_FUSEQ|nr:unnamed protein product [Fusarium equiseti]
MDSCIDISDLIGKDFEAAGINFFEFAPWTPGNLHFLGERWIVDSGDPDPDHALTLVTVMVYLAGEADAGLCEALSFNLSSTTFCSSLPPPLFPTFIQPTLCPSYSLPPPLPTLPMASPPSTPEPIKRSGTAPHDFATDSDLVDQTPAGARELQITPEHRRRFDMKLFDSWSTSHGTREIPKSPTKKTNEHSRIPVSVWSQDLPPSGAAKRKRDNHDDDTLSPKQQKCSPARKKGAKAFVSVTKTVGKGDDKIAFEYRGGGSILTTSEFLDFGSSIDLTVAKAQSLIQSDAIEARRTRDFNEEIIITTVRNWIVEAARVGMEPGSDLELNPMGEHGPASGAPRTYRLFLYITKRRKEYKNFEMLDEF